MEKELYPVFRVNVCFTSYAMDYKLIGAKSRKDLIENFDWADGNIDIFDETFTFEEAMDDMNGEDFRIEQIEGLYTDTPYKVLDSYSYYE